MAKESKRYAFVMKSLMCTKKDVRKRLPILQWIGTYNFEKLRGDVISGLAVALMVVPQSLAIASLAGLPPQHGLYSSFPGCFVYCLLGTSKDLNVGPTVLSALMADRYNPTSNPEVASLLAFTCGIALLIFGILKLSFIVQFISAPVFSGFISAASIIVAVGQLKDLLGLKNQPRGFFRQIEHLFVNIRYTRPGDAVLGIACLILLVSLHLTGKWFAKKPTFGRVSMARKVFQLVNVSKSALVVIIATILAYVLYVTGYPDLFVLAGELPKGLPKAKIPIKPIQLSQNVTVNAGDVIASFGPGIGLVPLIMFIESIAVAKALAARNNYKLDASQELIAVGISNLFGSFVSAFPFTGSLARSPVKSISGAATPASGVICGIIVLLAIQFITPVFKFIPMTVLASMVIAAVVTLIEFRMPRELWRVSRADLFPFAAAFFGCFYQLEIGVLSGVIVSLALILHRNLRPRVAIDIVDVEQGVATLKINGGVWFPGAEQIMKNLEQVSAMLIEKKNVDFGRFLVKIDCDNVHEMDYTVAMGLKTKLTELRATGMEFKFINIRSKHVRRIFEKTGFMTQENDNNKMNSNYEENLLSYESNV